MFTSHFITDHGLIPSNSVLTSLMLKCLNLDIVWSKDSAKELHFILTRDSLSITMLNNLESTVLQKKAVVFIYSKEVFIKVYR